jgi:hypothetical protein
VRDERPWPVRSLPAGLQAGYGNRGLAVPSYEIIVLGRGSLAGSSESDGHRPCGLDLATVRTSQPQRASGGGAAWKPGSDSREDKRRPAKANARRQTGP